MVKFEFYRFFFYYVFKNFFFCRFFIRNENFVIEEKGISEGLCYLENMLF